MATHAKTRDLLNNATFDHSLRDGRIHERCGRRAVALWISIHIRERGLYGGEGVSGGKTLQKAENDRESPRLLAV
jgi:hypothetical protein